MDRKDCTQWKTCKPSGFTCPDKCGNFRPIESKVIFESESQARKFYTDVIIQDQHDSGLYKRYLEHCKELGYIRKSPVEEAEEMEIIWNESAHDLNNWDTRFIVKLIEAIRYLKAENERLKK